MAAQKTRKSLVLILFLIIILAFLASYVVGQLQSNRVADTRRDIVIKTMYFCGVDRCKDSGEYGQLIFLDNINVWNGPEPNRGGVRRTAGHGEQATVVEERRVEDGPGGLWYRLSDGGWTNDLWLTDARCSTSNIESYSFTDCMMGEY